MTQLLRSGSISHGYGLDRTTELINKGQIILDRI
jgi:hypothetical protein